MADIKSAVPTDYGNQIMKKMNILFDRKLFCDVELIAGVDGLRIPAHRIVLSAASNFFEAIFTEDTKENQTIEVQFNELQGNILQVLISYCYSGVIDVHKDTVEAVLNTARLLQLESVVDQCADFMKTQLSPSTCLGIQSFAERYNCTQLKDLAQLYASKNFEQVVKTEEFFNLSYDKLSNLLSRDDLNVNLEENIFHCIMSWVQRDEEIRKQHLPQLLPHIRLCLMDPQFISDHVESVYKGNGYLELVCEAYKRIALPTAFSEKNCKVIKRSYGATLLAYDSKSFFKKYCPHRKIWKSIEEMNIGRENFGFAVWEDKLVAVGGCIYDGDIDNLVKYWDVENKTWKQISPLGIKRSVPVAVVLGKSLYALGGYNGQWLSCVERLDSLSGSWRSVTSLPIAVSSISAVAFDDCIYVEGYKQDSAHLFRYNPHTNIWTNLGRTNRNVSCFMVVKGDLYAFTCQLLQRYNKHTNSWTTYSTDCSDVEISCLFDDRILTVTEGNRKYHLKEFDLELKVWTNLAVFTDYLYNMFCVENL